MTTEILQITWFCDSCDFENIEEFSERPDTVTCGCCGEESDYNTAFECPECSRSFGRHYAGECEH